MAGASSAAAARRRRRDPGLHLADRRRLQPRRASTDLQLSPATVAEIFAGKITKWNDPAIAADNPGVDAARPAPITPVHRSDESGTTQNFTDYLTKAAPDAWTDEAAGDWPRQGRRGRPGHLRRRRRGARAARARSATPTRARPATSAWRRSRSATRTSPRRPRPRPRSLDESHARRRPRRRQLRLRRSTATTTAAGVYPIVLVSYQIACPKYSDAGRHGRPGQGLPRPTSSALTASRPPPRPPARRRSATRCARRPAGDRRDHRRG